MSARLQPAFWGGLFIGVLSALPFIGGLNWCCCLWVVVGGALTTYLLQERSMTPVTAGDAAIAGLVAGAIGAVVGSVLSPAVALVTGMTVRDQLDQIERALTDLPPEAAEVLVQLRDVPAAFWFLVSFVVVLVIYPIFSVLGALLGVAMFRRTPPPPPPGTVEVLPPE